jgi:hypothetical protein
MSLIDRLPIGGSRKKSQNPLQRAMSVVSELGGSSGRGKPAKRGAGTRGRASAQKRRRSRA